MKNDLLKKLNELTDAQTSLVIEIGRINPEIANHLHEISMAWVALAWDISGEKPDHLDTLKRHLEETGS